MMTRQQLRRLAEARRGVLLPGAFNALSARVVEDLGFEALYITGAGVTNMWLGLPDQGFMGLAEIADHTARIRDAVELPLLVDADTGFGDERAVARTVAEYEAAGLAGLHLEDQKWPKRCGHLDGKSMIPSDEMVIKVQAAAASRRDSAFVIIARTDARAVESFGWDAIAARTVDVYRSVLTG